MRKFTTILGGIILSSTLTQAQPPLEESIYRPQPTEWEHLVKGGSFIDRILPMPAGKLSSNVWGAAGVVPRYVDNGIEDDEVSYWGGNIIKDSDGLYHLFVCGWDEDNKDGHMGYHNVSTLYHTTSKNIVGPYKRVQTLGAGHNPEIIQLKDGNYLLYHIMSGKGDHTKECTYSYSNSLYGPWQERVLPLDLRDRPVRIGGGTWFHNMTFCKREDGSILMISRCGSAWVSETGTSPYNLITEKRIYPMLDGRYEDPVVWRDSVQYNLIVNDWIGRTAFYMRSKDGINWIPEPGQAYAPGVSVHEDGTVEDWFKYERIRIFQDEHGRAIQANFAVIDTMKNEDLANDNHGSKNISIPLNPGMLLTMLNTTPITATTKEIKVKISGEKDFNPAEELDINTLRFGASSEVNYGRGAKAVSSDVDGDDLIVTFDALNNCITPEEFAPKMLGSTKSGDMVFGYVRLPWVDYITPILSARKPEVKGSVMSVVVENFGQEGSQPTILTINGYDSNGVEQEWGNVIVPAIPAYGKTVVSVDIKEQLPSSDSYPIIVKILSREGAPITLHVDMQK